jgi:protein TonB
VPAPAIASPAPAATADPRARKQEADYFALLSAHLNRRKTYPVEARRAREQGVVTVRFTVDRDGNVSDVTLKRGSGHAILDEETLALVQRVAPMPRMPATMQRERLTLSLPIEYSLRTN